MATFRSDFLQVMHERGFIYQISDDEGLDALFCQEQVAAYIGFDPTAPSLHVGSLLQIMMLHWLQKTGHKPIVLMGGGTGLIGDPSFKDNARQLLTRQAINDNIASIKKVFAKYIDFSNNALLLDNVEWLGNINYVEFLRDIGKHFSINRMLSFDSVKNRLEREQSLSFLEFNYMILQAYDFIQLNEKYDARVQFGGSDQWGNIINGIDLAHKLQLPQLYALTSPLLTTSSGAKMGKTVNGAIWLNQDMCSAYEFWQYWRNCEDGDVIKFFKLYTTLGLEEIERFAKLDGGELNEAKKILATHITSMLHGEQAAQQAAQAAKNIFEGGQIDKNMPSITVSASELNNAVGLLSLIVKAGFATSNSEARRHIKGDAIKINDHTVNDENTVISKENLNEDGFIKLSFGKKKHVLIYCAS
ncbi:tyrosine--tRNA ligase [Bartonella sp. TP]|uniref:tyrosine--tRNA ligase n=1 Tax=Bartonella sp. TP TaxID=3057550 RepID=UPI0025B1AEF3|nr:tyrosine--tRNA ligase [Bartonella sp. TP]WJW79957.1 tyrosine--tRNA ligase [Bartonella sp. TP]